MQLCVTYKRPGHVTCTMLTHVFRNLQNSCAMCRRLDNQFNATWQVFVATALYPRGKVDARTCSVFCSAGFTRGLSWIWRKGSVENAICQLRIRYSCLASSSVQKSQEIEAGVTGCRKGAPFTQWFPMAKSRCLKVAAENNSLETRGHGPGVGWLPGQ